MSRRDGLIALGLGCISAIGPLGTDSYLPALPDIAGEFGGDGGRVQLSLMSFFLGFTVGQLFYGPVSDRTGRKPMIYLALTIFTLASLGCLASVSVDQLIAFRFAEGLGGSIGAVIGLAIIRDLYTGVRAARLIALVTLVMLIAPIVAPLLGSLAFQIGGWRLIFGILAGFGVVTLVLTALLLPETRSKEMRSLSRPGKTFHTIAGLLTSPRFIPFALTMACSQGAFFAYIAGSSFVFISLYGMSPMGYAAIFCLNALGLGAGGQVSARLVGRFSAQMIVRTVALAFFGFSALLLSLELLGMSGFTLLCLLLFATVTAFGALMPPCGMLMMEANGTVAGTAAALAGAMGFGAGALSSALLGFINNGTVLPMVSLVVLFSALGAAITCFGFGTKVKAQGLTTGNGSIPDRTRLGKPTLSPDQ